jgi:hypothetical protein
MTSPGPTGRVPGGLTRPNRSVRLLALILALGCCGLSSCAGSGYSYVSSTSTRTFFKVPDAWRIFHRDQIVSSQPGTTPAQLQAIPFIVIVDGDPRPSLAHDISTAQYPFGIARVRYLDLAEHDAFSLATLRNEIIHIDDLLNADANSVQVVSSPRLIVRGGLRGSRLAYTVHPPGGSSFTAQQIGLVDAQTHTVWFLLVGCQSQCYDHYRGAIGRVVDSWTVKGK